MSTVIFRRGSQKVILGKHYEGLGYPGTLRRVRLGPIYKELPDWI